MLFLIVFLALLAFWLWLLASSVTVGEVPTTFFEEERLCLVSGASYPYQGLG
jgi:hypothetical protein